MIAAEPQSSGPAVLIDTPVWRDYFRREEKIFPLVNTLMDAGRVCALNLVIAELVAEAATEEESKACRDFRRIFPVLPEPEDAWIEAAAWLRKLQKLGRQLALRDAYVAWMAKTHGVRLWTRNPLFLPLGRALVPGLKIFDERGAQR